MVKQVIHTDTGLKIPLDVIPSKPIHGKTIHQLVVEIDFETSERLHVKVDLTYSACMQKKGSNASFSSH